MQLLAACIKSCKVFYFKMNADDSNCLHLLSGKGSFIVMFSEKNTGRLKMLFVKSTWCIILLLVLGAVSNLLCAQNRALDFYLQTATQNNPALKENLNRQSINSYQNKITKSQFTTPTVSVTGDYLLAPYFNSNGNAIDITNNPSDKAVGYDVGITNGGWYSALLNVSLPVLTGKISAPVYLQNKVQLNLLTNEQLTLKHELDKQVTDQYLTALQLQLQTAAAVELIQLLDERIVIAGKLTDNKLMSQSDFLLLKIERGNRASEYLGLQSQFKAALNQLNNSCSIGDTAKVKLETPTLLVSERKSSFNYAEKYKLDSVNNQVQHQIFETRYLPQLNLYGNTGLNSSYAPDIPHNFGFSAGVHFAIPIYDGGQKKLNADIAQLNQQILLDYKSNNDLIVNNNLNTIQAQITAGEKIEQQQTEQLNQYQTLIDIYRQQTSSSQLSVIDFVNVLGKYAESRFSQLQSQIDLLRLVSDYNYINW